ncbi:hypothetical protein [Sorangium sp. So ce1182]|uniref:hypothetical protein n=1 Tax=Sorangium sp. So ce1182 TaxID=3133334 RepID=UPI003F5DDA1F
MALTGIGESLLAALSQKLGADASSPGGYFRPYEEPPSLDRPEVVEHLSRRQTVVSELVASLSKMTWLAMLGQIGIGKTHLAALLTDAYGRCNAWLRLRDTTEAEAIRRLMAALRHIAGQAEGTPLNPARAAASVGRGGLMVIDDIPHFSARSAFWEHLITLGREFNTVGAKIVTTSNYKIPTIAWERMGDGRLSEFQCPLFTPAEIAEVFKTFGAPSEFLSEGIVAFLAALSHGHPLLVSAIARYLRQQCWMLKIDVMSSLLAGDHSADIGREVLERLIESTENAEPRDLLYRLMLITGSFGFEHVRAVADVPKRIERPHEMLAPLLDTWIQADGRSRYVLSPLLTTLPGPDLAPDTERACHLALAELIYRQPSVGPYDVSDMVRHYTAAGDVGKALTMLAFGLNHLLAESTDTPDGAMMALWARQPLPELADIGLRVHVRALQAAVALKRGQDAALLLKDLDSLSGQLSADSWVHLAVAATVPAKLFASEPRRAADYYIAGLTAARTSVIPEGVSRDLEKLMILFALDVRTSQQMNCWVAAIEHMDGTQRERLFTDNNFSDVCALMMERIGRHEMDKLPDQQDWKTVDAALVDAAQVGLRYASNSLWVEAVRARTVVLGEYLKQVDGAKALGDEALATVSDARSRFRLNEAVGRQLLYAGRLTEARLYLEKAAEEPDMAESPLMVLALQNASWAAGKDARELALRFSDRAVELIQRIAADQKTEVLKAIGEQAVARWIAGERQSAVEALEEGATLFFEYEDKSPEWRRVALLFGRAVLFIARGVSGSTAPSGSQAPDTPTVSRGMFHTWQPDPDLVLNEQYRAVVALQLSVAMAAMDRAPVAVRWAETALRLGKDSILMLAPVTHPLLIANRVGLDDFVEVLRIAAELASAMTSNPRVVSTVSRQDLIVLHGMVPIATRLVFLSVVDHVRAVKAAEAAIVALRGAATTLGPAAGEVADYIDATFFSAIPWHKLLRQKVTVPDKEGFVTITRYICVAGCTDITPSQSVSVWLAFVVALAKNIAKIKPIWAQFVASLDGYWRAVFERARFQFSSPALTAADLEEAETLPLERRAQAILRAVATGLRVEPPAAEVQAWLRG